MRNLFTVHFYRSPSFYLFTTFSGVPAMYAWRLLIAIFIRRSRASVVAHAICGVMYQFFAVSNGLSARGGSVESTSTPAA